MVQPRQARLADGVEMPAVVADALVAALADPDHDTRLRASDLLAALPPTAQVPALCRGLEGLPEPPACIHLATLAAVLVPEEGPSSAIPPALLADLLAALRRAEAGGVDHPRALGRRLHLLAIINRILTRLEREGGERDDVP